MLITCGCCQKLGRWCAATSAGAPGSKIGGGSGGGSMSGGACAGMGAEDISAPPKGHHHIPVAARDKSCTPAGSAKKPPRTRSEILIAEGCRPGVQRIQNLDARGTIHLDHPPFLSRRSRKFAAGDARPGHVAALDVGG